MREHEMERSAATLPENGVDHLRERPGRDQTGDRFVLEVRLRSDVRLQADREERDGTAGRGRADGRDADRCESPSDRRTI